MLREGYNTGQGEVPCIGVRNTEQYILLLYSAMRSEVCCGVKCVAAYFTWVQFGEKCGELQ